MPIAQFVIADKDVRITKTMHNPQRLDRAIDWLKEARQVIPEIPNIKTTDWVVQSFDYTLDWVIIDLVNSIGERAYLRIARNRDAMTAKPNKRGVA